MGPCSMFTFTSKPMYTEQNVSSSVVGFGIMFIAANGRFEITLLFRPKLKVFLPQNFFSFLESKMESLERILAYKGKSFTLP